MRFDTTKTSGVTPFGLFGFTFAILLAGTLFSRANSTSGANALPAALATAAAAWSPRELHARVAAAVLHDNAATFSLGVLGYQDAERVALRCLERSLARAPARPVVITWTEKMRHRVIARSAFYLPDRLMLVSGPTGDEDAYTPVTPDGIRVALQRGGAAPFANANVFSITDRPER